MLPQFPDRRRRYDWSSVQRYYDEGHSYRECRARFGFTAMAWHKARARGEIRPRPRGMPLPDLLSRAINRYNLKARLIRAGILENRCEQCGINEWRDAPLSCHLDHINGVKNDHRLENLRMLCPNCHSQTATYGGKNLKLRRSLQDRGSVV